MRRVIRLSQKHLVHLYQYVLQYLRTKVSKVQYIIITATLVGLVSGMIAVLLKRSVHALEHLVQGFSGREWLYLLIPAAGLLSTTWVIQRFFKGHIERGIAMVLRSIARRSAFIPSRNNYIHFITSALTVGSGGSAGLESPIIATGASLGSTVARLGKLSYSERMLMIACGAAAGISAIYDAPIAGVMFAVEVLLVETMVSYFVPLIIAAVIGVLCSKIYLGESAMLNFLLKENFNYRNVPFYVVLGVGSGFVSLYYARIFTRVDRSIHHWKVGPYTKALIGGLMLAAIFLVFSPLYGEGYDSVKVLAGIAPQSVVPKVAWLQRVPQDFVLLVFTGCILFLKPVAAAITIGSGGNGGNFAPSVFVGAYWGFFFCRLMNVLGWVHLPESNFTLVGMAGVLAGVMYCPLTAIFLIAEISNGYELFIPLMIVASISYFIVKTFEPYYMETKQLALEGKIFTHKRERNILSSLVLSELVQRDHHPLRVKDTFETLVQRIQVDDRNIFAVVDEHETLVGILELNDLKPMLFHPEEHQNTPLGSILKKPPEVIPIDTPMTEVMHSFDLTNTWYLPVVSGNRRFVGFVSKSQLFEKYRQQLSLQKDIYDE